MAKQKFPLLTLSVTAAGAVTKSRCVTFTGYQASAAGAKVMGVAVYGGATGESMSVDVKGTTIVELGATVARGAAVMTDTSGRAVTVADNGEIFADTLEAGVTGDLVEVLLR